jgi:hypothetical protein
MSEEKKDVIRDDETYYAIKNRLSASGLKSLNDCPLAYKRYAESGIETTIHIEKGKLVHSLLLEPETVKDLYTFLPTDKLPFPDKNFQTKANREYRDEFMEQNKDKIVLPNEEDYKRIIYTCKKINQDKDVKRLLKGTEREVGLLWENFQTGVKMKGKPDAFKFYPNGKAKNYILDVKKLRDISPKALRKDIYDRFYHSQQAIYGEGLLENDYGVIDDYYILAVHEQSTDFAIYKINDLIEEGYEQFIRLATLYKNCQEANQWPGYEVYAEKGTRIINLNSKFSRND